MGFLDNKGLKKLFGWIRAEFNSLRGTINERFDGVGVDIRAFGSVLENKQNWWQVNTVGKTEFNNENVFQLRCYCKNVIDDDVYADYMKHPLTFQQKTGYMKYLPDAELEYIIAGNGKVFNDVVEWPSNTQMFWPNGNIPNFQDDAYYEIYIIGGNVTSYTESPKQEYSILIVADIKEEDVGKTGRLKFGNTTISHLKNVYINDILGNDLLGDHSQYLTVTPETSGPLNIRLDCFGDMKALEIYGTYNEDILTKNITKIDLSQVKHDCYIDIQNLGNEQRPLLEIIFPQIKMLQQNFMTLNVDNTIENFSLEFLKRSVIKNLSLKYNLINSLASDFSMPKGDYKSTLILVGNKTENDILRKIIIKAFDSGFYKVNVEGATNLKQIGSIHDPWRISEKCSRLPNLTFANITWDDFSNALDYTLTSLREVILTESEIVRDYSGPCSVVSAGSPDNYPKIDILVLNMPGYSFSNTSSWGFNVEYPTKVYIPSQFDEESRNWLLNNLGLNWTLHTYDSLDEIPFQYAPEEINNIKD